jgi:hypothetical protein
MAPYPEATDCFSGTCGLCINCTKNTINSFKDINNQNHEPRSQDLRRAEDLNKLMGKKYVEEATNRYNKNLVNWCKRYGYTDPGCSGYAPPIYRDTYGKFKLIEKKHDYICSDPYCKMLYVASTSWEQKSRYPLIPMYTKEDDNKLQICGPCIMNESFKN